MTDDGYLKTKKNFNWGPVSREGPTPLQTSLPTLGRQKGPYSDACRKRKEPNSFWMLHHVRSNR